MKPQSKAGLSWIEAIFESRLSIIEAFLLPRWYKSRDNQKSRAYNTLLGRMARDIGHMTWKKLEIKSWEILSKSWLAELANNKIFNIFVNFDAMILKMDTWQGIQPIKGLKKLLRFWTKIPPKKLKKLLGAFSCI